jgi:hypothetical protein
MTSLDDIFWVGNALGSVLVDQTTGRAYALITKTGDPFGIRLFLGWVDRLRFWRRLEAFERKHVAWRAHCYSEVRFESMFEAVIETDQLLEELGVVPRRVEPWERFYLLRRQAKEKE